jgi:hypothetical protein
MIQNYIHNEDGVISIEITPSNIDVAVKYIKEKKISSIFLESKIGDKFKSYDFLNEIKELVREISLINSTSKIEDFPILNNVKKLFISEYKEKIIFNRFPNLKEVSFDWNSKIEFGDNSKIEKLIIWGFATKSKNLNELSGLRKISRIEINQTNITSLKGIENLNTLVSLKIYQASKLSSIKDLNNSTNIRHFLVDTAKRIVDYDLIENIKSLNTLAFNNCGDISNLLFIDRMTNLKEFRFVNTKIIDGDISPCLKLQNVFFNDKKHYSHKYKYFN